VCIVDGSGLNFKLDKALISGFSFLFLIIQTLKKKVTKKNSKITQIYATNTFFFSISWSKKKTLAPFFY
jgi:hypothetical protein